MYFAVFLNHIYLLVSFMKYLETYSSPPEIGKQSWLYLIHHNKNDGGMLIVKTVLCELALAACIDS